MAEIQFHRGKFVLTFPYDSLLVEECKALPSRYWDKQARAWVIAYSDQLRSLCLRYDVQGWASAYEEYTGRHPYVAQLDQAFERAIQKEAA